METQEVEETKQHRLQRTPNSLFVTLFLRYYRGQSDHTHFSTWSIETATLIH
jgi:hypothetical protein